MLSDVSRKLCLGLLGTSEGLDTLEMFCRSGTISIDASIERLLWDICIWIDLGGSSSILSRLNLPAREWFLVGWSRLFEGLLITDRNGTIICSITIRLHQGCQQDLLYALGHLGMCAQSKASIALLQNHSIILEPEHCVSQRRSS